MPDTDCQMVTYFVGFEGPSIWHVLAANVCLRLLVCLLAWNICSENGLTPFDANLDTGQYIEIATNLITNFTFSRDGVPEIVRTPGYPLVLIPGLLTSHPYAVTILIHILFSCVTAYSVFAIGAMCFHSRRIGLLAGVLTTVEPLSVAYVSLLVTETVFTSVLTLSLFFLLRYFQSRSSFDLSISAAVMAAAAYVRPAALFLPIVTSGILFIRPWFGCGQRRRLFFQALLFVSLSMGILGVWDIRNTMLTGYRGFSAIGDMNLYFYVAAGIKAERQKVSTGTQKVQMGWESPSVYFGRHPEQRTWSENQLWEWRRWKAFETIIGDIPAFLKISLKGLVYTALEPGFKWTYGPLFGLKPAEEEENHMGSPEGLLKALHDVTGLSFFKDPPIIVFGTLVCGLFNVLCLALAVVGIVANRSRTPEVLVVFVVVVMYFFVIPLNVGYSRFRVPVIPILCILAACGLSFLISSCRRATRLSDQPFRKPAPYALNSRG